MMCEIVTGFGIALGRGSILDSEPVLVYRSLELAGAMKGITFML